MHAVVASLALACDVSVLGPWKLKVARASDVSPLPGLALAALPALSHAWTRTLCAGSMR